MSFAVTIIIEAISWYCYAWDLSLHFQMDKSMRFVRDVNYFWASKSRSYLDLVQPYFRDSKFPLVICFDIITNLQNSWNEQHERTMKVSNELERRGAVTSSSTAIVKYGSTELDRSAFQKQSEVLEALQDLKGKIMKDPQYSAQLNAYCIQNQTDAIQKNTEALNATRYAANVNTFATFTRRH